MRRRVLIAAGVVVVVAAGGAFAYWRLRASATPVSLGEALGRYRHGRSGTAGTSGSPLAGVYSYDTSGSEELSIPGTHRGFPARTTITVTSTTCGVDWRWDALEEHAEELDVCIRPDASVALASDRTDETFLGVATRDVATCDPDAWLRPPNPVPHERWQFSCRTPHTTWSADGSLVGIAPVRIAGGNVPALRLRVTMRFSGEQRGTGTTDYWFDPSDSLLLAWSGTTDVSQGSSPLGSVDYRERYSMRLVSTKPRR